MSPTPSGASSSRATRSPTSGPSREPTPARSCCPTAPRYLPPASGWRSWAWSWWWCATGRSSSTTCTTTPWPAWPSSVSSRRALQRSSSNARGNLPAIAASETRPRMSRPAGESPAWTSGSGEVEPVEIHDLVPGGHEVTYELLLRVAARIDLRDGPKLGIRAEHQVDGGGGPLDFAGGVIAAFVHVLSRGRCLPLGAHVEQVHEEVVGQRLRPAGEHAVPGLPEVGVQRPHAADQNRHLGHGQRQHAGPVHQEGLRRQLLPGPQVVAEPVGRRFKHGERLHVGLLL